jgi:hypothetical protein
MYSIKKKEMGRAASRARYRVGGGQQDVGRSSHYRVGGVQQDVGRCSR